ncbi:hypothetical protein ABH935_005331 [Catenulispora sp. GAS73]|uniref:hypothetical protein n=1 Tax=Catenulispora sp. GAS73 TaxID=3156269 RepID=UPI003513DB66
MTRTTNDPGDTGFPDGERLHEAFAEEIDRPGLDGPSYDAVLRSGNARLRRRRVTVGATFAVASVTAVATAVIATGGGASQNVNAADNPTNTTPAAAGTTTAPSGSAPGTTSSAATSTTAPTSPASPTHLPDAVITSGALDGHAWQLVREYKLDPGPPPGITSMPGDPAPHPKPQWCTSLNVIVDGVWTDAGAGGGSCVPLGQQEEAPSLTDAGFASIAIVTPNHVRLGAVVAGSVSPLTASVTAQCGAKSFTDKPLQPSGDNVAYYAFTLPNGSGCQTGALSFFDSSGSRVGAMSGVAFEGGK